MKKQGLPIDNPAPEEGTGVTHLDIQQSAVLLEPILFGSALPRSILKPTDGNRYLLQPIIPAAPSCSCTFKPHARRPAQSGRGWPCDQPAPRIKIFRGHTVYSGTSASLASRPCLIKLSRPVQVLSPIICPSPGLCHEAGDGFRP